MSIYLLFIININMFVKFWRREKNPKLTFSGCCCAIVRSTAKRIGGEIVAAYPFMLCHFLVWSWPAFPTVISSSSTSERWMSMSKERAAPARYSH